MAAFYTEWDDYEYELSLCRNYRNLKNFVENEANESWTWFQIRGEYLNQIKMFSKIELKEYHPDKNLDEFLEKLDEPFPVHHPHFFSHLPLQLTFFKLNRIRNLLDYHFNRYIKYFPEYEEAFLKAVQGNVVYLIEHNEIKDYEIRANEVLEWVRHKNEFIQSLKRNPWYIKITNNQFFDLSVTNIKNILNYINNVNNQSSPGEQKKDEPTQKKDPQKEPDSNKQPDIKIVIKSALEEEFILAIYEFVDSGSTDVDSNAFKYWFRKVITGQKSDKQYVIRTNCIISFCRTIQKFYDTKKAFLSPTKNILASWIVFNFRKTTPKGPVEIPYSTVYNVLKGSKK